MGGRMFLVQGFQNPHPSLAVSVGGEELSGVGREQKQVVLEGHCLDDEAAGGMVLI